MNMTFSFFHLTVHAYGLCIAFAAAVLLIGMRLLAKDLPKGTVSLFGVWGVVLGILGARLLYCVCNLSTFTETFENPWLMLCFFDGGFSMPGMLAGLAAAAAITARMKNLSFGRLFDAVCMPLGLSLAIMRIGELFTDLGVGKAVSEGWATAHMPWLFQQSRMGVAVEYRLNVWGYEAAAGLLLFLVMLLAARFFCRKSGDRALLWLSLYGASQTLLESMRDDGHMLLIFLRVGQLAAALLPLIVCGILMKRVCKKHRLLVSLVLAACVAGIVILEFSLDGRLTFGNPTLLRDYLLMGGVCVLLAAASLSMLKKQQA